VEHRHLFRTRRAQVFFEKRSPLGVQIASLPIHHVLDVRPRLDGRVDAADLEMIDHARHRRRHVRGWIGRAEADGDFARRELDGDGCRHGRLSNAAFAPTPGNSTNFTIVEEGVDLLLRYC
jgi:hypothetical protein